jgi:hypothetical protein
MDALTVRTIALRQVSFKWKKELATISLDLIYQSMVLSQPPSRDSVPLRYLFRRREALTLTMSIYCAKLNYLKIQVGIA